MTFFVYILYSFSSDVFYKGQTSDINARMLRHNKRLEKSTKYGVPWKLVWTTEKSTRSDAITLEKKLKNLSRAKLITFINKHPQGMVGPDALTLLSQWSGC